MPPTQASGRSWHVLQTRGWLRRYLSRRYGHLFALVSSCVLVASACTIGPDPTAEQPESSPLGDVGDQAWPPPDAVALSDLAERYGLDDPPDDIEFERYISPEEYSAVMVPCLTDQGIPVTALPDGGIAFEDIPLDQAVLQAEAMYRCEVRFPTHPIFLEPLDTDQLRVLYAYQVNDLTTCLESEGYATSAPPTVEVFIASYSDPNVEKWSPWPIDDPRLQDTVEWNRLSEACPQIPPLEVLYAGAVTP